MKANPAKGTYTETDANKICKDLMKGDGTAWEYRPIADLKHPHIFRIGLWNSEKHWDSYY